MRTFATFLKILTLSLVFSSCEEQEPIMCTTEFVQVELMFTDADGKGIIMQSVSAANTQTKQPLEVSKYTDLVTNKSVYIIASDGNKSSFSRKGDKVIVTVMHPDGRQKVAELILANGECHIEKRSGPNTIVFE